MLYYRPEKKMNITTFFTFQFRNRLVSEFIYPKKYDIATESKKMKFQENYRALITEFHAINPMFVAKIVIEMSIINNKSKGIAGRLPLQDIHVDRMKMKTIREYVCSCR